VQVTVAPAAAAVAAGSSIQFSAQVQGDGENKGVVWSVNGIPGGNSTVGMIDAKGNFTAPALTQPANVSITATSIRNMLDSNTASLDILVPGKVAATTHPLVALYSLTPPANSTVFVQFGLDTTYGFQTAPQPAPSNGAPLNIQVAGMRAGTPYHMRAVVQLGNGVIFDDTDQTFMTGAVPSNILTQITATTTPGMTPQSGIEMLDTILPAGRLQVSAIDLSGNLVWYYHYTGKSAEFAQPVQFMPNGDLLLVISPGSEALLHAPTLPAGTISVVREIDLVGNTVKEISIDDLNARLITAGYNITLGNFHHDVLPLPNGHWIVLTSIIKAFTDLPYHPGTINVLGDALVDLDANLNPVWVWNAYDHLNINRQPTNFPDWTHSNAVIYSPDDGNLFLSVRHQNWVLKIDYQNGNGAGDILWHLGYQGEFTLSGGTSPTDWFYAQHGPHFVSPNSTGKFSLVLFDNGDDRVYPLTDPCTIKVTPSCRYSTVPVMDIDEQAMTASISFRYGVTPYSLWGGTAQVLKNGSVEFDVCAATSVPPSSEIYEVTQSATPQVVWHLHVDGQNAYRAFRLPSLYQGIQW
jgi:arylsulfate sulfotransferase